MYNARLMLGFAVVILFILSGFYYYLTRDDIILVWNELPNTVQIEAHSLSPMPSSNRHPGFQTMMNYYHRFSFPTKKYVYAYFDFKHFQRYHDVMKGVQFRVSYQGSTYLLGCPKSYNHKALHLAIIKQKRKGRGIVSVCMPMDVHTFLDRFPEGHHHQLKTTYNVRQRLSDFNNRIAVFSAHRLGIVNS